MEASAHTPGLRVSVGTVNVNAEIDAAIKRFVSHQIRKPLSILLVIIPNTNTLIYSRVKLGCDVQIGLLNVCVVRSKFARDRNDQYFANVALKFSMKLGGRNQFLDISKLGVVAGGQTVVVGVVASVDQWLVQLPADLQIQTARKEMVTGLDGMLTSRLRLWMKNNKEYPKANMKLSSSKSCRYFGKLAKRRIPLRGGLPHISIVVVGKRHNTRFYPSEAKDADRSSNPQNGTVVDRRVTEARNWDFFVQAHTAIQGTARPAHYYGVVDEIFRNRKMQAPFQNAADSLEDLTHNMCYLLGRATKAVSICPPAYSADIVCERARCYLSRGFDATPEASLTSSAGEAGQLHSRVGLDPGTVQIYGNIRDTMFYI